MTSQLHEAGFYRCSLSAQVYFEILDLTGYFTELLDDFDF